MLPWWVSPLQGADWKALQKVVRQQQKQSSTLSSANTTLQATDKWPTNIPWKQSVMVSPFPIMLLFKQP